LPALLAKRTGAAILGCAIYTDAPTRWRMVFTEKIDAPGESVEELTAKMNDLIAEQIRRAPEDWFWVHNRWKTPRPNFLLARYKRGVFLPEPRPLLQPFRILVRASNWLGDSVMNIPAVRAIKAGRPDAHITVAAPQNIAAIWKLVPEVDKIVYLPKKSLLQTARLLRHEPRFEVGIIFPNSLRTAIEIWLAGIPRRVGYRGHWRSALLNQIVRESRKPGPPQHQSLRFLRIAEDCGTDTDLKPNSEYPPSNGQGAAFNQTSNIKHQTFIGLCPGAEYGPAKRWLPDRFAEVAHAISTDYRVKWILFGTKAEGELGKQIASSLGDYCINRIGQTTIEQLMDELRQCDVILTNDTGTMHLANLLNVPVVAIFGSTDPHLTGPLGDQQVVLRHHVECSPCFLRQCPIDFRCMKVITTDEVVTAIISLLRAVAGNNMV
jgi:heptosyltransferase-2